MVRRPRSARNTSSGPAQIAIVSKVVRSSRQQRSFADTIPSNRSDEPLQYLVPASTARSTPDRKQDNSAIEMAGRPDGTSTVPAAPLRSVQAVSSALVVGVPLVP